ncbi:hypothetical protein, partial [Brachyspira sp.]|uniref:hypothetical protein n=1 Tax=Brachyspira sp. TaxID=1977261 RepID=UPI003D7D6231
MRNIKTIFILVLSLILLLAVSCSNDDKTGGETETTVTIDAKDFPEGLKGRYKDDKLASSGFSGYNFETEVSYYVTTKKTKIEGS